jgi:hypothetical protein
VSQAFLIEHIYPVEPVLDKHSKLDVRWTIHPLQEELKKKARAQGLWNLWVAKEMGDSIAKTLGLPRESLLCGAGLTNLEYAHCCEVGHCFLPRLDVGVDCKDKLCRELIRAICADWALGQSVPFCTFTCWLMGK